MKFYAVRKGRTTGIFTDWETCHQSVHGYKNSEFKSFPTEDEARAYLNKPSKEPPTQHKISDRGLQVYTDGSYDSKAKTYGSGLVAIDSTGNIIKIDSYKGIYGNQIQSVAGEIYGAMIAMHYAYINHFDQLIINHDFEGISKWCLGLWKCNNPYVQKYKDTYDSYKSQIDILFMKVDAHTGNYYNDLSDVLAKYALGLRPIETVMNQYLKVLLPEWLKHTPTTMIENSNTTLSISMLTELSYDLINFLNKSDCIQASSPVIEEDSYTILVATCLLLNRNKCYTTIRLTIDNSYRKVCVDYDNPIGGRIIE